MKKVLTLLAVLLVLSISMAAFRDIPKGHWAESFVTRLEEAGIATGFPDGTYRGDEAITRYQIAVFLVRTLDYVFQTTDSKLDSLKVKIEGNVASQINALKTVVDNAMVMVKTNSKDIETLQFLVKELQEKLEKGEVETTSLNEELQNLFIALEDAKLVLDLHDQDIIKLYDLVNSIQDKFIYTDEDGNQQEIDLVALKSDIQTISEILNGLAAQLGDVDYLLRKQIADLNKNLTAQISELNSKTDGKVDKEELETIKSRVELLEEYANMIYDLLGTKVSSDEFESALADLDSRLSELETQVLNIQNTLDTGLPAIRDMVYELYNNLTALEERVTTYTDVRVDELIETIEALKDANELMAAKIEQLEEKVDGNYTILNDAIMGIYEELNTNNEKVELLSERVNLLENQVVSLGQVVEEVKADKSEVEEVNEKLEELKVEKSADVKRLEQMAQWGIGLGIVGIIIGIFGWFRP
uniref:SLH domain-containing protein n=1 Tax=Fervidobacterium pennivorans TaxID=93466 RepID=A0A7V4KBH5_FERPE